MNSVIVYHRCVARRFLELAAVFQHFLRDLARTAGSFMRSGGAAGGEGFEQRPHCRKSARS